MEKTNDELLAELNELKQKYSALEVKYNDEVANLKNNEDELRLKLLFLEGVANSTIDGFLVVNPYGQKILQNKRTIELWKIPKEVVEDPDGLKQVNHVMHMTVNPKQFVAEIDYLRDHPNDRSRDELELIDGTVLDRYSSPVIGPDGINYGRIWTFHDVTERKQLERYLFQLNKDKDHFISILAHDLRNPLNSILGYSGLIKNRWDELPVEKIKKMVESINNAANKTYQLLEDTLLWASIHSKKLTFNPSDTNLSEIIDEVIDILSSNTKIKNIQVKNNTNPDLHVNADVYMLKAIFRNLISNAIKFTNEKGIIEITAKHENSDLLIQVTDNGVGIQQDVLDSLFSFTSAPSSQGTQNESGAGLGLILCKEFVDKHKGEIWIESDVNKGTTVNFTIPYQEQAVTC